MESSVSLETLPPEDSDLYIPNLSSVQTQNVTSLPGEALLQSMQIPAIRYPPAAPVVPPAAATVAPTLVAAPGPGSLIHGIYRTTLTTQVIAAQAFHYPPTPPIDGSLEVLNKRHLQLAESHALTAASESIMENEPPASMGYDKPINPFPSLPTPPDVEVQHHSHVSQAATQHQQHCASNEELQTSIAKMSISHQQQWATAQQTANISYFMPQASVAPGGPIVTYSNATGAGLGLTARRGCPPGPVPALHQMYSASLTNNSLLLSSASNAATHSNAVVGDVSKKMPAIPALVKDDVRPLAPHEYVYCMDPGTVCGSISPSGVGYTNKHCSNCSVTVTPLWRRNPDGKYVCNACGLYYRINGTHRNGTQKKKQKTNLKCMNNKCSNCGTTKTVLWRRMENGDPVCNPCGLYYKLNGYSRPLTLVKETIQTRNRKSTGKSKKKGKKTLSSHLPLTPPLSAGLASEGSPGNIFSSQLSPGNYILAPPSAAYEQQHARGYGEFNYTPVSFPSANGYNHAQQQHLYGKQERSEFVCVGDSYGTEDVDDLKPNIVPTTTAFNVVAPPHYSTHSHSVGRAGVSGMDTTSTFHASTYSAFSPFASEHDHTSSPLGQSPNQTNTHSPLL